MSIGLQTINNGSFDDDPSADKHRIAWQKAIDNFQALCDAFGSLNGLECLSRIDYDALSPPDVDTMYIVDEGAFISIYKGTKTLSSNTVSKYKQSFVIADWTTQQIIIPAATHGMGVCPQIQIKDSLGDIIGVEKIRIDALGNITIAVISGSEFDGNLVIT